MKTVIRCAMSQPWIEVCEVAKFARSTPAAVGMPGAVAFAMLMSGCVMTTVEPGHRGLYFEPGGRGLLREVLPPDKYKLGWCFIACTSNRIDDFDVTYSTRTERIRTKSTEGLDLDLTLSVIYRPVVSELYELDTEIGTNYYEEVIGPEFRSAARGVFAHHSYMELQKKNESIEDEVENEVRRRTRGKHVEISSVTLEAVTYAPEIAEKIRERIAGEQEAARQQAAIAWEGERQRLQLQKEAETARFKAEEQLAALETQKKVTQAESEMASIRAEADAKKKILLAKADAEAAVLAARARAEEKRAETAGITPMEVMIHAYDALGQMGGSGTTVLLGDWSHVPNFLFPHVGAFQSAFNPYATPALTLPSLGSTTAPSGH
ncbi:MAG: SPFH domain-containing protein [Polyangiaceae bacterium]